MASPYLLFEIWRFVSPALYPTERKFALPFIILGSVAFALGMVFAYGIVIPYGYKFLLEFGSSNDQAIITLKEYFGLTLKMLFALGLVFELPVVLILLGKLQVIDAALLIRFRRHAFLGVAVLAAVITPSPDAFTMMLVTGPLWLLYEFSIWGVKFVNPRGESRFR